MVFVLIQGDVLASFLFIIIIVMDYVSPSSQLGNLVT